MSIAKILIAIGSLMLIMVGVDKFLGFLQPPCSLESTIPVMVWKILGVIQIAGGILIWLPQFRRFVLGFFVLFMLFFTIYHITQGTYDIGGSAFMAVLFGFLLWNPRFIRGKQKSTD